MVQWGLNEPFDKHRGSFLSVLLQFTGNSINENLPHSLEILKAIATLTPSEKHARLT